MNMHKFDKDIWYLHRKLFHRYLKYEKYFRKATEELPELQRAIQAESLGAQQKQQLEEVEVSSYDAHMMFTSYVHI